MNKKYNDFCSRKIRKISSKNNYKFLTNFHMSTFDNENEKFDHIIFGKKYIYILSNFYLDGDLSGDEQNNSWILTKPHNQGKVYVDNISSVLSGKSRVFSTKINANPELIASIAIVNNECEIKVNGINKTNNFIVHYSYLKKLIKKLEARDIQDIDSEQLENKYENLKNENE